MTAVRFDFQQQCVAATTGTVLNVGCNTDPAHLQEMFGDRVINCDDRQFDVMLQQPIPADLVFDCSAEWPLSDDDAELIVLGDILEHLTPEQQVTCLQEARRVASKMCITVPNDARFLTTPHPEVPGASFHVSVVDEARLRGLLDDLGWEIDSWETVDYGFVPEGYFVWAHRVDLEPRALSTVEETPDDLDQ